MKDGGQLFISAAFTSLGGVCSTHLKAGSVLSRVLKGKRFWQFC
jgi:hypothetical protein